MNEELELRKRLQSADPGRSAPELNEGLVAQAALSKKKRFTNFKLARFTMAAASLSIVGLAVTSVSLFQPAANEPLFTLAGSGQSTAMSADASSGMATTESGRIASDSMMIWPSIQYNYIPGKLSMETGRGKVYQAELTGDPIELLTRLAEFFGIEAEPKFDEWATEEYPSYSIQEGNTSLGIYFSGAGNWYFSTWDAESYSCISAADEDGVTLRDESCDPKPTPDLIPIESDLIAQASSVFAELGFAVDISTANVWRNEWGASVSFANVQNGINTGMDFYASWDARGTLNYLAGYSFRLVERGEFDTVSAFDAVSRIEDGRWYGSAPSSFYEDMAIAYEGEANPMARDAEIAVEDIAPEPESTNLEPEQIELRVESAQTATLSVFDAAGNYWFVPGYFLFNDQGWFDSIISLQEGVIELPEPYEFEIMPYLDEEPLG